MSIKGSALALSLLASGVASAEEPSQNGGIESVQNGALLHKVSELPDLEDAVFLREAVRSDDPSKPGFLVSSNDSEIDNYLQGVASGIAYLRPIEPNLCPNPQVACFEPYSVLPVLDIGKGTVTVRSVDLYSADPNAVTNPDLPSSAISCYRETFYAGGKTYVVVPDDENTRECIPQVVERNIEFKPFVGGGITLGGGPASFDPYMNQPRASLGGDILAGGERIRGGFEGGIVGDKKGFGLNNVGLKTAVNAGPFWANASFGTSWEPSDGGDTPLDGALYYGLGLERGVFNLHGLNLGLGANVRHTLYAVSEGRFDPLNDASGNVFVSASCGRQLDLSFERRVTDEVSVEEDQPDIVPELQTVELQAYESTVEMPTIKETTRRVFGGDPSKTISQLESKPNHQGAWEAYLYAREQSGAITPHALNDAASAARSTGRVLPAYLIWRTFPISTANLDETDPFSAFLKEKPSLAAAANNAVSEYESNYGYVSIVAGPNAELVYVGAMPFEPVKRQAIERIISMIADQGEAVDAFLPVGRYQINVKNKAGRVVNAYVFTVVSIDSGQGEGSAQIAGSTLPLQTFDITTLPRTR